MDPIKLTPNASHDPSVLLQVKLCQLGELYDNLDSYASDLQTALENVEEIRTTVDEQQHAIQNAIDNLEGSGNTALVDLVNTANAAIRDYEDFTITDGL